MALEIWETFASLAAVIGILVAAAIIFAQNRRQRWAGVESDSLRRVTTPMPATKPLAVEVTKYEYEHAQLVLDAPMTLLLAPKGKHKRYLDQYAVGLSFAEFPVTLVTWNPGANNICPDLESVVTLREEAATGRFTKCAFVMFQDGVKHVLPYAACAAKNPQHRWILISPELPATNLWDIFQGNGANVHILHAFKRESRQECQLRNVITRLQIPPQNVIQFPVGGKLLAKQETVVLGKIITWLSNPNIK